MNDNHDDRGDQFEQHPNENPSDYNKGFFGTVGSGKTHSLRRAIIRNRADGSENSDWIDPKGEREGEEHDG